MVFVFWLHPSTFFLQVLVIIVATLVLFFVITALCIICILLSNQTLVTSGHRTESGAFAMFRGTQTFLFVFVYHERRRRLPKFLKLRKFINYMTADIFDNGEFHGNAAKPFVETRPGTFKRWVTPGAELRTYLFRKSGR